MGGWKRGGAEAGGGRPSREMFGGAGRKGGQGGSAKGQWWGTLGGGREGDALMGRDGSGGGRKGACAKGAALCATSARPAAQDSQEATHLNSNKNGGPCIPPRRARPHAAARVEDRHPTATVGNVSR